MFVWRIRGKCFSVSGKGNQSCNMKETFRVNNFDLIRLVAALQVVFYHTVLHLEIEKSNSLLLELSNFFPGVPIFFFVSGFLISKSYESNPALIEYTKNRVLRIYPALIVCTFVTIISVYLTGYLSSENITLGELLIWIGGQISIFQFYNPEFMREFGTGVLNGSLWTITVELQFYIMVPLLYGLFRLAKPDKYNKKLFFLIIFFMVVHLTYTYFKAHYDSSLIVKLLQVSFIPWIYMFLVGVFFQQNFLILHRMLSGKGLYVTIFYLAVSYISVNYIGLGVGNEINPILYLLLCVLIFSLAYSIPTFSKNILRGNDISYGVYIYHIPIINLLIYYGYVANMFYVVLTLLIAIFLAIFSWLVIEKNSMKFKKYSLNPLNLIKTKVFD